MKSTGNYLSYPPNRETNGGKTVRRLMPKISETIPANWAKLTL